MPVNIFELGPLHRTGEPGAILMDGEHALKRNLAGRSLLPLARCERQLLQCLQSTLDCGDHVDGTCRTKLGLGNDDLLAVEVDRGPGDPVLLSATDASSERDVELVDPMQSLLSQC